MHSAKFRKYHFIPSYDGAITRHARAARSIVDFCRGNRHHSDENLGALTANSAPTGLFLRHFDKHLQKFREKQPVMTSSSWLFWQRTKSWERKTFGRNRRCIALWHQVHLPRHPEIYYWLTGLWRMCAALEALLEPDRTTIQYRSICCTYFWEA